MIRILFFTPLSLEYGRGGELSIIELASGLEKYFDVTLIDTNRVIEKKVLDKRELYSKLSGLKKVSRFNYLTVKFLNKDLSIPKPIQILRLYKEINKVDIVYTSLYDIKTILLLIIFRLLNRKIKIIIGFRKPLFSEKLFSIYNIKNRIAILLLKIFKKNIYLHTISRYAKNYLDFFYKPNRVYHIIHAIDLNDYLNVNNQRKDKSMLNFLYVGHLDAIHKGIDILINAIRKILSENINLNIKFEFCGTGPLESEVKKLEKDFPNKVKAFGFIDHDKIAEYYMRNDVFLFTSRREPFGRVLIEALAAKLLIICSKTYGSVEILKNQEFAFFLKELNPINLSQEIKKVYSLWKTNPDKFYQLQDFAYNFAFKNYTFSKELDMFREFFKRLN
ncbi:MAG: glycosyltransferase family 4 protein [Candidatus Hodarchaeota archaeon]